MVELGPPHAREAWSSPAPLTPTEVLAELSKRGCHSTDATEALDATGTEWRPVHDAEVAARYICPVCGYPELSEPPWDNGAGSDEICPSCGTHFGYDDAAGGDAGRREQVHRQRRSEWIAGGMRWWSRGDHPLAGWDPGTQVAVVADE